MKTIIRTFIITSFFWSCIGNNKKPTIDNNSKVDSIKLEANSTNDTHVIKTEKKSVEMYKFPQPTIQGDFDGDGITETLHSKLYSKRDKKLMNEYPVDCEMGCICEYDPVLFLKCDNTNIPTLYPGVLTPQLYGIAILSNIGDMNNDGTDEIAAIINYASYSGLNTCYIYGMCNNNWKQLFSFRISESSLIDDNGYYAKNPYDVSKFIFKKDSSYFYNELGTDKYYRKKMPVFKKCS